MRNPLSKHLPEMHGITHPNHKSVDAVLDLLDHPPCVRNDTRNLRGERLPHDDRVVLVPIGRDNCHIDAAENFSDLILLIHAAKFDTGISFRHFLKITNCILRTRAVELKTKVLSFQILHRVDQDMNSLVIIELTCIHQHKLPAPVVEPFVALNKAEIDSIRDYLRLQESIFCLEQAGEKP